MIGNDKRIKRSMPWGWWLTRDGDKVFDENGKAWPSVRNALFDGLWPKSGWERSKDEGELLLRALKVIDQDGLLGWAETHGLFDGSEFLKTFYGNWLVEVGLVAYDGSRSGRKYMVVTNFGHSVMKMLKFTREKDHESLSMREIRLEVGDTSPVSEELLAQAEKIAAKWPARANRAFRDMVHDQFLIKFSHLDLYTKDSGGMPMSRVVWSIAFRESRSRDLLFAWMCERSIYWDKWGELAHRNGARALTDKLLTILISEQASLA